MGKIQFRHFRAHMPWPPAAICALLLLGAAVCAPALAQDGSFDPGFAQGGRKLFDVSNGLDDTGTEMHLLPDGKILMAGTCDKMAVDAVDKDGNPVSDRLPFFCVARLLPDGTFDPSFGPGGVGYLSFHPFGGPDPDDATSPFAASLIDMALLPDERIVLVGSSPFGFHASHSVAVAVLRADGSALDPAVADGVGAYYQTLPNGFSVSSIASQRDGKLLLAGTATGPTANLDMAVARLDADFSGLDQTFGDGGIVTVTFDLGGPTGANADFANSVIEQEDGRLVVVGGAYTCTCSDGLPPLYEHAAIAHLLPDGTRDPAFGPAHDGRVDFTIADINGLFRAAIDRRGRIVVVGAVANASVSVTNWLIARLMPDGSFDPTFHGGAPLVRPLRATGPTDVNNNIALDVALEAGGSMFIGGTEGRTYTAAPPSYTTYFGVLHLLPDGTADPAFGGYGSSYGDFGSGEGYSSVLTDIAIGNGGLMVGGYGQQSAGAKKQFGIARLQYGLIFRDGFESP
ncbi:MAG TPA: hypothetical protein VFG73_09450 [Rhodanobacteraceae bacterium]|nr:hypothetical protein [Rhodanobacteraceae bacterium]